ncbi:MAG: LacI family DNA-binding transcriptional regulator [Kiritimatiellota bacterium]|nr:LacI family DNA-binding transcriptional regulator [Kiritimatiellota bacterium]
MTTIYDVAKKAGVAPITVSRVINQTGYISADKRQRVEAAVAELGYVPNRLASSLRSRRTHTLALVLSDITNPFFTNLARGVEDTASDAGFTVIFCNTDESEAEEQKYLDVLLQKRVDGILLVPARSNPDTLRMLQHNGTPVVVLDRRIPQAQADVVRGDSEGGAYQLTRLLLGLGHRCIAMLTGPKNVSTSADRVAGYWRALSEAGLAKRQQVVFFGDFRQASGYQMTQQALAAQPRPTALVAANNFITIGALKALQEAGLRVPEDMALVGFDDLPPAMVAFPFFTVATQPSYAMGQTGTRLLLERLENPAARPFKEIILPTEVIVRQSSGVRVFTHNW